MHACCVTIFIEAKCSLFSPFIWRTQLLYHVAHIISQQQTEAARDNAASDFYTVNFPLHARSIALTVKLSHTLICGEGRGQSSVAEVPPRASNHHIA